MKMKRFDITVRVVIDPIFSTDWGYAVELPDDQAAKKAQHLVIAALRDAGVLWQQASWVEVEP